MDYFVEVENNCPAAIVSQVRGLDTAAELTTAHHMFNAISPDSDCLGAVVAYLLSDFPANPSASYARTLFWQATKWPNESDNIWTNAIVELLSRITVRDAWERKALMAFIIHNVDRRTEFPAPPALAVEPFGSTSFRASPMWNRNLYQANLGDEEAIQAIENMLKAELSPDIVALMLSDLKVVRPQLAKSMLALFENDLRHTSASVGDGTGLTLADIVETRLRFMPE